MVGQCGVTQTSDQSLSLPPSAGGFRTVTENMWQRSALAALLVGTAITYIWNISINGNAN